MFDVMRLQNPPMAVLPRRFDALFDTAKNIPSLMQSGASVLRREVRKIPLLDTETLSCEGEVRLLLLCCHMIQSAYIHVEDGESVIPKNIALPSYRLSAKLTEDSCSTPPILKYFSYVRDNYKRKDADAPFSPENLEPLMTFTGRESEAAFILTHLTPFEFAGEKGKRVVLTMRKAIEAGNNTLLLWSLESLTSVLLEMQPGFAQIEQNVSSDIYRNTIRRYLMSFTHVIYDGVEEYGQAPQSFTGASGAQTATIPSFSLALGIRYTHPKIVEAMTNTRTYLHPKDQRFMRFIEEGPNVREYILKTQNNSPELVSAYNTCLGALDAFRVAHTKFIALYVAPTDTDMDTRGTGNTVVPWWLTAIIKETRWHYIQP